MSSFLSRILDSRESLSSASIRCKHSFIGHEPSSSHSSSIISNKAWLWEELLNDKEEEEREGGRGREKDSFSQWDDCFLYFCRTLKLSSEDTLDCS